MENVCKINVFWIFKPVSVHPQFWLEQPLKSEGLGKVYRTIGTTWCLCSRCCCCCCLVYKSLIFSSCSRLSILINHTISRCRLNSQLVHLIKKYQFKIQNIISNGEAALCHQFGPDQSNNINPMITITCDFYLVISKPKEVFNANAKN